MADSDYTKRKSVTPSGNSGEKWRTSESYRKRALERERRALGLGASSTYSGFGSSVKDSIGRLTSQRQTTKGKTKLKPAKPRKPIGQERSEGRSDIPGPLSEAGAGAGIASPVTEEGQTREYYDPEVIYSSDGVFSITVQRVKTVHMRDNSNENVEFVFAEVPDPL